MCRRSRIRWWFSVTLRYINILCLIGCCFLVGLQMFLRSTLLGMAAGSSDSSQAFKVCQSLGSLLFMLFLLSYGIANIRSALVVDIKNRIQRVIDCKLSDKNFDESYEKRVSGCTGRVDGLIESVPLFFVNFVGGLLAVLISVMPFLLLCLDSRVFPTLLVLMLAALVVVCLELLSYWCKKKLYSSDSSSSKKNVSDSLKGAEDPSNHCVEEKESVRSPGEMLALNLKKTTIEFRHTVYKFLPLLITTLLMFLGILSPKFQIITIGFCSSLLKGLHDAISAFPKMKEHLIDFRTFMEGSKSKFEWRYLWHLLSGTGQFAEPREG